jgi:hypothetical protein
MTPKEKAKELVNKYWKYSTYSITDSDKQCALIAVEEIIDLGLLYGNAPFGDGGKRFYSYWQEVKEEILKL